MFGAGASPRLAAQALVACIALVAVPASAAIVQTASIASLAANDRIHWGQQVSSGVAASFQQPTAFVSNGGITSTVSNVTGPAHNFVASVGQSAFEPSQNDPTDSTLSNCCNFQPPFFYGDLTISFAVPIRGLGAFVSGPGGAWTVNMMINNDPQLVFSASGDRLTPASATTFPFLGVISDALDITSIRFTATGTQDVTGLVTIDDLRLLTTAVPPPPTSPTPEPATWVLFIGGFGLVGATMRRRRGRVARSA